MSLPEFSRYILLKNCPQNTTHQAIPTVQVPRKEFYSALDIISF